MQPLTAIASNGDQGANTGTETDPRLKPAAHEFEACLMKEFLKPLQRDALFDDEKDSDSRSGSDNALMSFGSEALARAISDRGGFGIATKIIGQLEAKSGAGSETEDSENSFMLGGKK
jgi:Rod binding domain-containing protein